MKTEHQSTARVITIRDADGLDPITVTLMDHGHGQGNFIVECYGTAWATYWGAMGADYTLTKFIAGCHTDYIVNRLARPKELKRDRAWLTKIVDAIKEAIKLESAQKISGEHCEWEFVVLSDGREAAKPGCKMFRHFYRDAASGSCPLCNLPIVVKQDSAQNSAEPSTP